MNRFILFGVLLALTAFDAGAMEFEEGTHYQRIPVPVATADPSRVEVVEAFSYACIHCKSFDPAVEEWHDEQGAGVDFQRLPAIFNATWALFAQAYYTAEVLGVTDQVHAPIFKAIHEQGMDLRDPGAMALLFETFAGVSRENFDQVYYSFGVRSKLQQAQAKSRAYGITGTPSMIVDGTFRTDGQMSGSNAMMLEVVDFLVAKQAAERDIDLPPPGNAGGEAPVPAAPAGLSVDSE
ncbi:MAG: thiol:disulfide interchange protein DsbA/DsbL [Pseudomonadales bacterium]